GDATGARGRIVHLETLAPPLGRELHQQVGGRLVSGNEQVARGAQQRGGPVGPRKGGRRRGETGLHRPPRRRIGRASRRARPSAHPEPAPPPACFGVEPPVLQRRDLVGTRAPAGLRDQEKRCPPPARPPVPPHFPS